MNRRAFNRLGTAAVIAYPFGGLFATASDGPWKLGIITDQVDFDGLMLSTFYSKYRLSWGRRSVTSNLLGRTATSTPTLLAELKQMKKQLDDAGVKVSVLDTAIYKIALPGTNPVGDVPAYMYQMHDEFVRQIDDLKLVADAAHELGARIIRIFTFRRVADPAAIFDRVVEELQRAIAVARQHDIGLLVENEYDCNTATGEEIARLFKAIPDRQLMHNWDSCNCYEMGERPFPTVWNELDHSRISHVHLKDAAGKEWKPIGSGEIDFVVNSVH